MAGGEQEDCGGRKRRIVCEEMRFVRGGFAITAEIAVRPVQFRDSYPKNPQDRLIGATAIVEGIRLLTHDPRIAGSGLVPLAV